MRGSNFSEKIRAHISPRLIHLYKANCSSGAFYFFIFINNGIVKP